MSVRISDPRPPYCSACFQSGKDRYVDFDAAFDAGAFADRDTQVFVEGSDDLHLCDTCVREAMDVLSLKPELHSRQLREITRLELAVEHWRDQAQRNALALAKAHEAGPEHQPRERTQRRKVAA